MIVQIDGTNLPGKRCGPGPRGEIYDNIHVGLGIHQDPFDLVPGDARSAHWRIEVRTSRTSDGSWDYHGTYVHGQRGDRFLYLNWGTVAADGTFTLFRRAKLSLSEIDPKLVESVSRTNGVLTGIVGLTDHKGNPTCARVRPPELVWKVTEGNSGS